MRCNYKLCLKCSRLRSYSFLNKENSFPTSVAYYILENFIFYGINAEKLKEIIDDKYKTSENFISIQKYLLYVRKIMFQFMKIKYNKTLIGGFNDLGDP